MNIHVFTKIKKYQDINDDGMKIIRSGAGKSAWLAAKTSPLASVQAGVVLQRGNDNKQTIHISNVFRVDINT